MKKTQKAKEKAAGGKAPKAKQLSMEDLKNLVGGTGIYHCPCTSKWAIGGKVFEGGD